MSETDGAQSYNFPTTILTEKPPAQAAVILPHALDAQQKLTAEVSQWFESYLGVIQNNVKQLKSAVEAGQRVFNESNLGPDADEFGNFPQYWNCLLTSLKLEAQSNELMIKNLKQDVLAPLRNDQHDVRVSELLVNSQELTEISREFQNGAANAEVQWNYKAPQIFQNFEDYKAQQFHLLFNTVLTFFQVDSAKITKGISNNENSTNYLVSNYKLEQQMHQYLEVVIGKQYRKQIAPPGHPGTVDYYQQRGSSTTEKKARRLSSFNSLGSNHQDEEKRSLKSKVGSLFGRKKDKKKNKGGLAGSTIPEDASVVTNDTASQSFTNQLGRSGSIQQQNRINRTSSVQSNGPDRGRQLPPTPKEDFSTPLQPQQKQQAPSQQPVPQAVPRAQTTESFDEQEQLKQAQLKQQQKQQQFQQQQFQQQQSPQSSTLQQSFQQQPVQQQPVQQQPSFQQQPVQQQPSFQQQPVQQQPLFQQQPVQQQPSYQQQQQSSFDQQQSPFQQQQSPPQQTPQFTQRKTSSFGSPASPDSPSQSRYASPAYSQSPTKASLDPRAVVAGAAAAGVAGIGAAGAAGAIRGVHSPFEGTPPPASKQLPQSPSELGSSPNVIQFRESESEESDSEREGRMSMLKRHDLASPRTKIRDSKFSFEQGDETTLPEPTVEDTLGDLNNRQGSLGSRPAPPPPPSRKVVHHEATASSLSSARGISSDVPYAVGSPASVVPSFSSPSAPLAAQDTGMSLMKSDVFKHFEHGYSASGLNASVAEVVNAKFTDGHLTKSQIVGEVAFNYQGEDAATAPPVQLEVIPYKKFDRVVVNHDLLQTAGSENQYQLLPAHITAKTLGGIKYFLKDVDVPVVINQIWKYEQHQASLIIIIKPNPSLADKVVLENLVITVALETSVNVSSAKSSPHGSFNTDKNRLTWRYTSPVVLGGAANSEEKLMARFMTSSKGKESDSGVQVKFSMSKPPLKLVQVTANGQEVPVTRNLISGNYSGYTV